MHGQFISFALAKTFNCLSQHATILDNGYVGGGKVLLASIAYSAGTFNRPLVMNVDVQAHTRICAFPLLLRVKSIVIAAVFQRGIVW